MIQFVTFWCGDPFLPPISQPNPENEPTITFHIAIDWQIIKVDWITDVKFIFFAFMTWHDLNIFLFCSWIVVRKGSTKSWMKWYLLQTFYEFIIAIISKQWSRLAFYHGSFFLMDHHSKTIHRLKIPKRKTFDAIRIFGNIYMYFKCFERE